jgi:hypothetical protein
VLHYSLQQSDDAVEDDRAARFVAAEWKIYWMLRDEQNVSSKLFAANGSAGSAMILAIAQFGSDYVKSLTSLQQVDVNTNTTDDGVVRSWSSRSVDYNSGQ